MSGDDDTKSSVMDEQEVMDDAEETLPKQNLNVPARKPAHAAPEAQFNMFMDPMFVQIEKQIEEQNAILDKINDDMRMESERTRKEKLQAHLPEPLRGRGLPIGDVMKRVENMIAFEINDEEIEAKKKKEEEAKKEMSFMEIIAEARKLRNPETHEDLEAPEEEAQKVAVPMQKLDDFGRAAVTSHSLAAMLNCLPLDHHKKVAKKIMTDCQLWLSKMFRFDEGNIFYSDHELDGLVRVCRLAMYQKYPSYVKDGFEALYSRPPVIYLNSSADPHIGDHLCRELGLPKSSICTVPCKTVLGSSSKMDTDILDKLIMDDIAAAKTPVAVMAYAGTPNIGHVDDIEELQGICKNRNIWMHVTGDSVALLALIHPPGNVYQARLGDSITVTIGTWLGIPALPVATMFKLADPNLVHSANLTSFDPRQRLTCLPLWVVLQSLGIENIEERISQSCELADAMFEELSKIKTIVQFSRDTSKNKERVVRSITELISKAISSLMASDVPSTTVVFRYAEDKSESSTIAVAPYAMGAGVEEEEETEEDRQRKHNYYNSLNIWLAESLQADNPCVEITLVDLEREGTCMKFAPLQSAQIIGTTREDVVDFVKSLKSQISILDATVLNYERFRHVTSDQENLRLVDIQNWAGLGAVQYIPNDYLDSLDSLSEQACAEINHLNIELIQKLKATDSAFSLGFTSEDLACVKFGLITEDTDVTELISLVQTTGKEVEESARYLESMSELVMKGIEEANKDLEYEKQHKLQQEGFLRQLPMISSVLNWWSPPPKDVERGRTFNLLSGVIASTEETYKYKMQLQKEVPSPSSVQRSRTSSNSGSISSQTSLEKTPTKPSPGPQRASPVSPATQLVTPGSAGTKSAASVKADLVNSINEGDLSEGHESQPALNGNLRLNLEN
ncbi:putative pyridoxal-dependent decarboxylase domain-containing protein 2 isoform X2 [Dreissena polymorpha]|uniref:putative pyridoxal-dependent decarboxylase domain-containing protein 2 isoform X2 n=1 Tax=Dreissena polymorpha TaxID=45954 RepID=UPI00226525AD|nr:putative pyridoxal-dependent decarboxylase domain-containing protein 2 isoform X2 [Dreissena polymorpha]